MATHFTDINIVPYKVNADTGDGTYTVSGIAANDVVTGATYARFSAGAVQTAGTATVAITAANTLTITGIVSTALVDILISDKDK